MQNKIKIQKRIVAFERKRSITYSSTVCVFVWVHASELHYGWANITNFCRVAANPVIDRINFKLRSRLVKKRVTLGHSHGNKGLAPSATPTVADAVLQAHRSGGVGAQATSIIDIFEEYSVVAP